MLDPETRPRSYFPHLCLVLCIFSDLVAGMLMCDCPTLFYVGALFAGLAFWRGTPGVRLIAAILFLANLGVAITQTIKQDQLLQRVNTMRAQQNAPKP